MTALVDLALPVEADRAVMAAKVAADVAMPEVLEELIIAQIVRSARAHRLAHAKKRLMDVVQLITAAERAMETSNG